MNPEGYTEAITALKQGNIDAWNQWRSENAESRITIQGEEFKGVDFGGDKEINLRNTEFSDCVFRECTMKADLTNSEFIDSKLSRNIFICSTFTNCELSNSGKEDSRETRLITNEYLYPIGRFISEDSDLDRKIGIDLRHNVLEDKVIDRLGECGDINVEKTQRKVEDHRETTFFEEIGEGMFSREEGVLPYYAHMSMGLGTGFQTKGAQYSITGGGSAFRIGENFHASPLTMTIDSGANHSTVMLGPDFRYDIPEARTTLALGAGGYSYDWRIEDINPDLDDESFRTSAKYVNPSIHTRITDRISVKADYVLPVNEFNKELDPDQHGYSGNYNVKLPHRFNAELNVDLVQIKGKGGGLNWSGRDSYVAYSAFARLSTEVVPGEITAEDVDLESGQMPKSTSLTVGIRGNFSLEK